jgi:hypothetical protein
MPPAVSTGGRLNLYGAVPNSITLPFIVIPAESTIDPRRRQRSGDRRAGELRSLIGIEDLGAAEPRQHRFQHRDAESGVSRVRQ